VATYALELLGDRPDLDVLYVPVGQGSGVCGCIAARDALGLRTEIVAVQSAEAPAYALSIAAGHVVRTDSADTLADGMATRVPDEDALAVIRRGVARFVLVSDAEIADAMRAYWTDTHNLTEGAGAAALAAAVQEKQQLAGKKVGLVLSGGNIDFDLFQELGRRARRGPTMNYVDRDLRMLPMSKTAPRLSALALFLAAGQGESREPYALGAGRQRAGRARARGRLFSARSFNIESLTVAEVAHETHQSRITIVTSGTPEVIEQVRHQLERLVPVHSVTDLTLSVRAVERELAMVKVRGRGDSRVEALQLAEAFRAKVIDATTESFIFEITGAPRKIDDFVDLMRPIGLVEVSRTGIAAISRGPEPI